MWPRPRSLVHLLLASFVLVTLPLLTAVYQADQSMQQLVGQSRHMVTAGIEAARLSQDVKEILVDMERRARQFQVLENPQILALYRGDHERVSHKLTRLHQSTETTEDRATLEQLQSQLNANWTLLQEQPGAEQAARVVTGFHNIHQQARALNMAAANQIDRELSSLQQAVEHSQQQLFVHASLMGPITLLLIVITTFLINRPIGQLDQAIRGLGGGCFKQPIAVDGPRDLAFLGERLEWLRERLNQLEQQKTQFLRHISHELKTPLAGMREGTELLGDRIIGPLTPQQDNVVKILDTNSRYLQKLIENLLDYNHIQTGVELNPEPFEMVELVAEVVAHYRLSATRKNLRFQLPDEEWHLVADRAKVRTALDNLVSNAVNFSPQNGWIRIQIRVASDHQVLDIRDQGPGVPEGERTQIFEPFFQGSTPRQGHLKGSGIGLSIAHECIAAHGARLTLGDNCDGACFRIEWPMAKAAS
ncbi:sensor histidine kinase [Acanthopleuribacter pedis]|uniref:histidine kinase n=1 Tax=Acanthopleuribacter pedis TaxID=442870 RepID=A0A8J7QK13_9BACT|nr:sensor histidine kinase [Acanthopleuribacter pedis]MBO1319630.1 hypothetical protein [Acanthopleuribacter pedis]